MEERMSQGKRYWREDILILSGKTEGRWIEEPDDDDHLWLALLVVEVKSAEFRVYMYVIPKTWRYSDGYSSDGEQEMRSDRGGLEMVLQAWWPSRAG